jgi:hypothetical protein
MPWVSDVQVFHVILMFEVVSMGLAFPHVHFSSRGEHDHKRGFLHRVWAPDFQISGKMSRSEVRVSHQVFIPVIESQKSPFEPLAGLCLRVRTRFWVLGGHYRDHFLSVIFRGKNLLPTFSFRQFINHQIFIDSIFFSQQQ